VSDSIEQLREELAKAQAAAMQLNDIFLKEAKGHADTHRLLTATAESYEALLRVKEASSPLLQFAGANPAYIDAFNQAKERFEGTQRVLDKITREVIALMKPVPR
jgi:hypothetical protein